MFWQNAAAEYMMDGDCAILQTEELLTLKG
jgi:hypothetical protein